MVFKRYSIVPVIDMSAGWMDWKWYSDVPVGDLSAKLMV
jgi:hypothetical protein